MRFFLPLLLYGKDASARVGVVRACGCVNGVVRAGCVSGADASMLPPRRLDVTSTSVPQSGSVKIG